MQCDVHLSLISPSPLSDMDKTTSLSFVCDTASAPGFTNETAVSLKRLVERSTGSQLTRSSSSAHRPTQLLTGMCAVSLSHASLGRPAAIHETVLIGTDDPEAKQHHLFYIRVSTMLESMTANPILSLSPLEEVMTERCSLSHCVRPCSHLLQNVRDVRWLSATAAICATGEGNMHLYSVMGGQHLMHSQSINGIHEKHIRELAVNTQQDGIFASGGLYSLDNDLPESFSHLFIVCSVGFDGRLCITDVHDGSARQLKQVTLQDQIISSVKWPKYNASQYTRTCNGVAVAVSCCISPRSCFKDVCVSCTTDAGMYGLFDTRSDMQQPAVSADLGKHVSALLTS